MGQGSRQQHWWAQVADIKVEVFAERDDAGAAELNAIRTQHPTMNVAGVEPVPLLQPVRSYWWSQLSQPGWSAEPHELAAAFGVPIVLPSKFADDRQRQNALATVLRAAGLPRAA